MILAYGGTDTGKTRATNQDFVFVSTDNIGVLPNLFIVADGMGGHTGGEIASRLAAESFAAYAKNSQVEEDGIDLMLSAILASNRNVFRETIGRPELKGMGTTLTAAMFNHGKVFIVHIGDSRAYAVGAQKFQQITRDHTYIGEMLKAGQISEADAKVHPKRNILTRAIGAERAMECDTYRYDLEKGDCLLLCSDGLYNMVDPGQIHEIIIDSYRQTVESLEYTVQNLISAANQGGGRDNISVILAAPQTTRSMR